jgi:hypothetical protein
MTSAADEPRVSFESPNRVDLAADEAADLAMSRRTSAGLDASRH